MLVGEQPGDQEDKAGRPFVGPAGAILDRAMADAGIDRDEIFLTNGVKHYKHTLVGKRRLHKRPNAGEIQACRWWLKREIAIVRPALVVALGATAVHAILGKARPIGALRGKLQHTEDGVAVLVAFHPSWLLRMRDKREKQKRYGQLVADLAEAARISRERKAA
jgi:uracil-DNA glycosylase family protein